MEAIEILAAKVDLTTVLVITGLVLFLSLFSIRGLIILFVLCVILYFYLQLGNDSETMPLENDTETILCGNKEDVSEL